MTFLKDKIKGLSLINIAGINDFAIIDIFNNQIKLSHIILKNGLFATLNNTVKSFEIFDSFNIKTTDNQREFENDFLIFIEKINKKKTYFILSTSQCRTKIFSIPKTSEDIAVWLEDNRKKILPDIHNPEQFAFSFEIFHEDEDNFFIALSYSRKDHIEFFNSFLARYNIKILLFTTYNLVLNQFQSHEINKLSLILLNDKLIYSYFDNKKDLIIDELFLLNHDTVTITNALLQIKENIFTRRNKSPEPFEIILNCDNLLFESTKQILINTFGEIPINANYPEKKNETITQVCKLKKLIKNFDNCTNFLEHENTSLIRDEIEKEASMRISLMLGGLIVFFLIGLNIFNYFIKNDVIANEDFMSAKTAKVELLIKLDKDKSELNKKMNILNNLKWNRNYNSRILYLVSDALTQNTVLTSLQTNNVKNGIVALEIEGCSQNQEDVSIILNNLEKKKEFNNVTLSFSNKVNTSDLPNKYFRNNYVKYKITCSVNANKK